MDYKDLYESHNHWIGMEYVPRYRVFDDGFDKYIEDTSLTEDKHEGHLYDSYDACRKLNEQDKLIEQLVLQLERKDILLDSTRRQNDARIDLFNKFRMENRYRC